MQLMVISYRWLNAHREARNIARYKKRRFGRISIERPSLLHPEHRPRIKLGETVERRCALVIVNGRAGLARITDRTLNLKPVCRRNLIGVQNSYRDIIDGS